MRLTRGLEAAACKGKRSGDGQQLLLVVTGMVAAGN